jgi:hypothetical protein
MPNLDIVSCGLVSRVFLTQASILARKQSGEVHESFRTSGKSSLLNPARSGQLAHEPAPGTRVSSCLSNGADASCSKMFDSIHAANSRTGIRIWVLHDNQGGSPKSRAHRPREHHGIEHKPRVGWGGYGAMDSEWCAVEVFRAQANGLTIRGGGDS